MSGSSRPSSISMASSSWCALSWSKLLAAAICSEAGFSFDLVLDDGGELGGKRESGAVGGLDDLVLLLLDDADPVLDLNTDTEMARPCAVLSVAEATFTGPLMDIFVIA